MESLTDSDVEAIVVIEDTDRIVVVEEVPVVNVTPTPARRASDKPLVSPFADDPFVVDWAPPQS